MRRGGRRIPARDPVTGLFLKGHSPRKAKAAAAPKRRRRRRNPASKATLARRFNKMLAPAAAPAKPKRRRVRKASGTAAARKARATRKTRKTRKAAPKRRVVRRPAARKTVARNPARRAAPRRAAPRKPTRKPARRKAAVKRRRARPAVKVHRLRRPPKGWVFFKNPAKRRRRSAKRWHVRGHWSHRRNPSVMQWVKSIALTIGGYAAATALANYAANHLAKHIAAQPTANQTTGIWGFLGVHGRPLVGAVLLAGTVLATRKVRKLAPYETPLVLGAGVALFNELLSAYLPPDSAVRPYVAQLPAPNPALGAIDVYEAALAELQAPQLRGYVQDGMGNDLESDEGISLASDEWYDLEGNMGSYVDESLSAYVEEPLGAYVAEPMAGYVDGGEDFGAYVEEPLAGGIFGEDQDKEGASSLEGSELYEALGAASPPTSTVRVVRPRPKARRAAPPTVVVKQTTRQGEAPAKATRDAGGAPGLIGKIKPAAPETIYQDGSLYAGQVGGIFRRSMFEGN